MRGFWNQLYNYSHLSSSFFSLDAGTSVGATTGNSSSALLVAGSRIETIVVSSGR